MWLRRNERPMPQGSSLRRGRWPLCCGALVATVGAFLLTSVVVHVPKSANAASSGDGDCWRPGTYVTCTFNYVYSYIYFTLDRSDCSFCNIPATSGGGREALTSAMNAWSGVPGPQFWVTPGSVPSGSTWIANWIHDCPSGCGTDELAYAATHMYPSGDLCFVNLEDFPCNVWYSDIYVVSPAISQQRIQIMFTHEMGHAMGLAHHASTASIMWPRNRSTATLLPSALDYGDPPACNEDPVAGPSGTDGLITVRCIYGW